MMTEEPNADVIIIPGLLDVTSSSIKFEVNAGDSVDALIEIMKSRPVEEVSVRTASHFLTLRFIRDDKNMHPFTLLITGKVATLMIVDSIRSRESVSFCYMIATRLMDAGLFDKVDIH